MPDMRTAVSFLCMRTRAPDEDDWGKLKQVLKYLYDTKHMKLCLTADNLENITWWGMLLMPFIGIAEAIREW